MQLTEILKQPEGFTPPETTVTIEKVYAYKEGQGTNGPWSFQDVQVTGGKLKLKNLMREFPESRVGMTVTIRANQSKQHGLTGLKVAHEEYQNKIYDKLIVTNSARWEWAEPGKTFGNENGHSNGHAHDLPSVAKALANDQTYADHVLACAELAKGVVASLGVEDPAAIQACFATICIDSKNRNILLPRPSGTSVSQEPDYSGEPEEAPDYVNNDPFGEEEIPF